MSERTSTFDLEHRNEIETAVIDEVARTVARRQDKLIGAAYLQGATAVDVFQPTPGSIASLDKNTQTADPSFELYVHWTESPDPPTEYADRVPRYWSRYDLTDVTFSEFEAIVDRSPYTMAELLAVDLDLEAVE